MKTFNVFNEVPKKVKVQCSSSLQTKFFITENTVDMMMTEIAEQDPWVGEYQQP